MRNLSLSSFIVFFLLISTAIAQPMRDQELRDYLNEYIKVQNGDDGNLTKAGMFLGYLRGVLDSLEGTALCSPNNISMEYLLQQVVKYIQNRDQLQREVAARTLVFDALRDRFACQR